MLLVHTSDWHIGKSLDGVSRIDEQSRFLDDFVNLVDEVDADMVIIAGDVYDTYHPPVAAESLFYQTIKKLSNGGKRCVFIIAGNHDSPEKLESVIPLVSDDGIIILGYPNSCTKVRKYKRFEVLESSAGFTKLKFGDEVVNIASLPYPSEKRLNEFFDNSSELEDIQKSYSLRVGEFFEKIEKNFDENQINIATSHIFVVGSEISDSERRIELGGSLLVEKNHLPKTSQYTALGHIHKPQCMSKTFNAYYSGSPIQYSKNEKDTSKTINLVKLKAGCDAEIEKVMLNNYKPIRVFKCKNLDDALDIAEKYSDEDIYSYFEIVTDEVISLEAIKLIKKSMKNVLEIRPIYNGAEVENEIEVVDINMNNIKGYFIDYFKKRKEGIEPSEEVVNLFLKFVSDDELEDDTDESEVI